MRSGGAAPPWRQPPQGPLVPAGGGGPGAVLSDNPKGAVCGEGNGSGGVGELLKSDKFGSCGVTWEGRIPAKLEASG